MFVNKETKKKISYLLVGVPSTILIGKHRQLHSIPIRRTHHTCIQLQIIPLHTRILTFSKVGNPLRHIRIELVLSLGAIVEVILVNVASVGGALVAVNVFLVGEFTGDGCSGGLLGIALGFGELALGGLLELTAFFIFVLAFLLVFTFLFVLSFVSI